ncbi:MAG: PTS sugar transporter subunit IIA [Betaproteobacteria bacterium]
MIGILLVSHEPLGTALLNCTRHIFGRLPIQLAALDVIPDEDPDVALNAARELLARINDGSGVIVLTDVFGATPSRIATQLAERDRVVVVAGVNLPLLIKALGNRRGPVDELIDTLIESGQRAIRLVDGADLGDSQATPQEAGDGTR